MDAPSSARRSTSPLGLLILYLALASCSAPQSATLRGDEVTWTVEYKGWACGEFAPQLMPVEGVNADLDLNEIKLGLEFYAPSGLSAPDQIEEVRIPGNHFLIHGHFYYQEQDGRKIVQPRFDLLGWDPVAPLQRWEDGEAAEVEDRRESYGQSVEDSAVEPEQFVPAGKYISC